MSRPWSPNEPARQPDYRRMYGEVRKLYDRIASQDSCITYLLIELRAVQKRLAKLEAHNVATATWKLKAAYDQMDELEQRGDLPAQECGDPAVGHPVAGDGN